MALTQSQYQLAEDLSLIAYSAIHSVLVTGSGRGSAILDFQSFINQNRPMLNASIAAVGGNFTFVDLVTDGAWGSNTARAMDGALALLGAPIMDSAVIPTPTKSAGIAAWYAQHQAAVDSLIAAAPQAASTPLTTPQLASDPNADNATPIHEALNSGAVVQQIAAQPVVNVPVADSPVVAVEAAAPPDIIPSATMTTGSMTDKELLALQVDTDFATGAYGEGSRVIAGQRGSRVPLFAVAAGAASLGGLMYWWVKRKKRKAA